MNMFFQIDEKLPINFSKNNTQKREKLMQKNCRLAKKFGWSGQLTIDNWRQYSVMAWHPSL